MLASVVAMVNLARLNLRKGAVGFVNPVLYTHSGLLNDITSRSNAGCGTDGFSVVPGWDPATGWECRVLGGC